MFSDIAIPQRKAWKILWMSVPVLNFSMAGLYSEIEKSLVLCPASEAISQISSSVSPIAELGTPTPSAKSLLTQERSRQTTSLLGRALNTETGARDFALMSL